MFSAMAALTLPKTLLSIALERTWHTLKVDLRVKNLERCPECGQGDSLPLLLCAVCYHALILVT